MEIAFIINCFRSAPIERFHREVGEMGCDHWFCILKSFFCSFETWSRLAKASCYSQAHRVLHKISQEQQQRIQQQQLRRRASSNLVLHIRNRRRWEEPHVLNRNFTNIGFESSKFYDGPNSMAWAQTWLILTTVRALNFLLGRRKIESEEAVADESENRENIERDELQTFFLKFYLFIFCT